MPFIKIKKFFFKKLNILVFKKTKLAKYSNLKVQIVQTWLYMSENIVLCPSRLDFTNSLEFIYVNFEVT